MKGCDSRSGTLRSLFQCTMLRTFVYFEMTDEQTDSGNFNPVSPSDLIVGMSVAYDLVIIGSLTI